MYIYIFFFKYKYKYNNTYTCTYICITHNCVAHYSLPVFSRLYTISIKAFDRDCSPRGKIIASYVNIFYYRGCGDRRKKEWFYYKRWQIEQMHRNTHVRSQPRRIFYYSMAERECRFPSVSMKIHRGRIFHANEIYGRNRVVTVIKRFSTVFRRRWMFHRLFLFLEIERNVVAPLPCTLLFIYCFTGDTSSFFSRVSVVEEPKSNLSLLENCNEFNFAASLHSCVTKEKFNAVVLVFVCVCVHVYLHASDINFWTRHFHYTGSNHV